jgi:DMSO/TMAO reductase YedYZ heme-binding membrane subunit
MFDVHFLLYIFIVLCIIGLILWGINQIPGIPPIIKTVIYVIIGVVILVWLLNYVGSSAHFGRAG